MVDIVKEAKHHFAKVHAASEGEFLILMKRDRIAIHPTVARNRTN